MPKAFSPDGQREMSSVRADAFPLPGRFPSSFSLQGEFTASDCLPASILPTVRLKTATACFHRHISCCSAVLHCSCVPLFSCCFMPPFLLRFRHSPFPCGGLIRKIKLSAQTIFLNYHFILIKQHVENAVSPAFPSMSRRNLLTHFMSLLHLADVSAPPEAFLFRLNFSM